MNYGSPMYSFLLYILYHHQPQLVNRSVSPSYPTLLPTFDMTRLFNFIHSKWQAVVLIWLSLGTNNLDDIFCISSLGKCLLKVFTHFVVVIVASFVLSLLSVECTLHILGKISLLDL